MDESTFDVIIVGGGVAGCATALSLMRSAPEAQFIIIDNGDPARFKIGESLPSEARRFLHYLSPSIIERLVQDTVRGVHTHCTGNASVWESPALRETFAIMNPFGKGWHLDRAIFDESLRNCVRSLCDGGAAKSSKVLNGSFTSAQRASSGWVVNVRSGSGEERVLRSAWLVDASGRRASVAHNLGAKTTRSDGLLAFYTVFSSTDVDQDHRTLVEAAETGWWYSSQLPDQRRVVVFHTDDCDTSAKVVRRLDAFLGLLHANTTHISKVITDTDYRPMSNAAISYPQCTAACSSFLSPYGDKEARWCAVGDSAIAFDPLSSQGMITALRMGCSVGAMLAKQLPSCIDTKESFDFDTLNSIFDGVQRDYEQKKQYFYYHSMFGGDFWKRRRG